MCFLTMSVRQRAEHRIPKLRAMLESETSLRLKPVLWGKMDSVASGSRRRCGDVSLSSAKAMVAIAMCWSGRRR